MTKSPRRKSRTLFACCACGDPTTGAKSESTGKVFGCCPDCAERTDEQHDNYGNETETDDGDRGPYVEQHPFPACPKCRSRRAVGQSESALHCWACDHDWRPRGIYFTKRQQAEYERETRVKS